MTEPAFTVSHTESEQPLVLIAEDARVQIRLAQISLERAGYRVSTALDGREALEKIRSEPPDLVILDVEMPEMNGFQVLDHLRRDPQICDIPVLMLTAHAKDSGLFDEWATDKDRFMTKPFSPHALIKAVHEMIQH